MANTTRTLGAKTLVSQVAAVATLCSSACSGPDKFTEPLVSEGGTYFDSLGGLPSTTNDLQGGTTGVGGGASALGGTASGGAASGGAATGGNVTATFDWNSSNYDSNGGANVAYQTGHFAGLACLATCHAHSMTFGGTAYQANGTSAAANAEIGLLVNGNLTTTYAGSAGNFFATVAGTVDWATAQIAIRSSSGTSVMPVNANATGNCNDCHGSTNRIVVP